MSVTQDSNGWTVVSLPGGNKAVYVAAAGSGGSDSNNGLTSGTPKLTIAAGLALLNAGDHLLLNRGDTFTNQTFSVEIPNGASATEPTYIGAYGTGDRPQILTGVSTIYNDNDLSNVVIQGLYFRPHTRPLLGGPDGFRCGGSPTNLIIEDCYICEYVKNVIIEVGGMTGVQFRRNIIVDAYAPDLAAGLYVYSSAGTDILIDENVFDRNGSTVGGGTATQYNHNVYIAESEITTVTIRDNTFARCPSSSLKIIQVSGQVTGTGNLFVGNGYDGELGHYGGEPDAYPGLDIELTFEDNVSTEGTDADGVLNGWGFRLRRISSGTFKRNVIANRAATDLGAPFVIEKVDWGPGVHNLTVQNNVLYNTLGTSYVQSGANSGLEFIDNIIQEPNLDIAGGVLIDADSTSSSVVTFAGGIYNRGGSANDWFDPQGTFALWQANVEPTATSAVHDFTNESASFDTYCSANSLTDTATGLASLRDNSVQSLSRLNTTEAARDYMRVSFNLPPLGTVTRIRVSTVGGRFAVQSVEVAA
jgi:hypothetical protein